MQIKSLLRKAFGLGSSLRSGWALLREAAFTWMGGNKRIQVTEGYANKIVYAAVNILVPKLIEAPMITYKVVNERYLKRYLKSNYADDFSSGKNQLLQQKALEEVESHPIMELLKKPNSYQTFIEMMEAFWAYYELVGDGFIWSEKPGIGRRANQPIALHVLNSDRVKIVKSNNFRKPIEKYLFTTFTGEIIEIMPEDILHLQKWSPLDPSLGGYSPQNAAAKTISKSEMNQIAQGKAFQNGGTGLIISSDVGMDKGQAFDKLTSDQVDKIKETITSDWAGASNNQKIHVTNGYVSVQKLGDTLADLKLVEAAKEDWKDIFTMYGISTVLSPSDDASTESNVKQAYKTLVTNNIVPKLRKFDEKFNAFIKGWYEQEIVILHDLTEYSELAPDLELMKKVYGDAWYITPNEKRRIFNYDYDTENEFMNQYFIPTGLMPVNQLLEPNLDMDAKQFDYRA